MLKILFLIHDLGAGGAERVLINLVNHMDKQKFDITVMTLFDVGVNKQNLASHIHYRSCFKKMIRGNSHIMKLLSPQVLHKWLIGEHYDIEVSYLEGPSARVISGCDDPKTKLVCWIHSTVHSEKEFSRSFRSLAEAAKCYGKFQKIVCVSEGIKKAFYQYIEDKRSLCVLHNTVDSEKIISESFGEQLEIQQTDAIKLVSVGTLKQVKGYDRLLRLTKKMLEEQINIKLYIIGDGPLHKEMKSFVMENGLEERVVLLGYQSNPYKYIAKCDLFICASYSEGFSTAVTEALILGIPVCTTDVSGMKELLGENNEYGLVTENKEESLYHGVRYLVLNSDERIRYREKAATRGRTFNTAATVDAVQDMFIKLGEGL